MRFLKEIISQVGLDEELFRGVKYVVFDGHSGYFENVKGVKSFSPECVELFVKGGCIKVDGDGLSIKKYYLGDAVVTGNIRGVTRE